MPELPDLVYIEDVLSRSLLDRGECKITEVFIREPVVLRNLTGGKFDEVLLEQSFRRIFRHGPFLCLDLDTLSMVIHPMLVGKFSLDAKPKKGAGLIFQLSGDSFRLSYLDTKKMGKVYLASPDRTSEIPGFAIKGLDILGPDFTLKQFTSRITKRRQQVRVFLMDNNNINTIGNAYADEILFDSRIHPKTPCNQLSSEQIETLFKSVSSVMQWGIDEVRKANRPIEEKVRKHMKVRNRKGELCPRCGSTIRRESVLGFDTFYCPVCQPSSRQAFIDWNKKS